MLLTGNYPPLIIILGATAVGKTKLSIELAQRLNGEIIGADSRQIYGHMDIGTAKPSPDEQKQIPHHMIDIINPDYNLTVAEYQDMAYQKINDLHEQKKLPFLVGGTGQYLSAVEEGWSIPRVPPNPEIRAEFEAYVVEHDAQALHEKLQKVDVVSAEKIHPNNVRRVIRALEVYRVTGEPISKLQEKKPPPYRILTYGLKLDRDILYPRVDKRVDSMIENGFIEEVQTLLDMGYSRTLPSMSGLGYLELAEYLLDGTPLDEAIEKTKFSTHDFIRRQDVWFRGHDNGILWHNVEELDVNAIEQSICDWLEGKSE
jgi:tRNA dimethylallyltransferase